MTYESVLRYRC